jgi:nucleoid-associated protein YgaU
MLVWVKLAVVVLGAAALGGAIAVFGLPQGLGGKPPAAVTAQPAPAAPQATPAPAEQPKTATAEPQAPAQTAPVAPQQPSAALAPAAPAGGEQVAKAEPAPAPAQQAASQAVSPPPLTPPSFDIVRVEPSGEAVIAGRADPEAQVTLLRDGSEHDKAKTDPVGQFAMVPPPFKPGTYDLSLASTTADGRSERSRQTVTVSVPAGSDGEVIVALASPDKPTQVLRQKASGQLETAQKPIVTTPGARPSVALTTVEAEDSGKFFVTGAAAPGAVVRLYLNETFLAAATAAQDGRFSFTISRGLAPGAYRVRIDDVDPKGTVLSRAEVPFDFAPRVASAAPASGQADASAAPAAPETSVAAAEPKMDVPVSSASDVVVPSINATTVVRGDSLWRISKRVYGRGLRYTVIYQANQQQIRDPHRIYPGQLFVLPEVKAN